MIEDNQQRVNVYGNILYPLIKPIDYISASRFIDLTVDYLNSKKEYSKRGEIDKALGVFLIKKMWESSKKFDINYIGIYIDEFFKYFDANYKKYVNDLIILSADDNDLLLSFTIEYVNNKNWNNKLLENEKK